MRAWTFQDPKQVVEHGEAGAAWCAGWYDPDGKRKQKSFGPGTTGKRDAFRHKQKIQDAIRNETYMAPSKATWAEFRALYEAKVLATKSPRTRDDAVLTFAHFERLMKPAKMRAITSELLADYIIKRLGEDGIRGEGSTISPATVNKDLRYLRAALRKAHKWGYLSRLPDFDFQREPGRLPTYIDPEHFAAIYKACDAVRLPVDLPYSAGDWWRGLLTMAYMTGWRIGSLLSLRRADVDLDAGTALSRAEHNKGKRDQKIDLHPVVVEHLRKVQSFDPCVFPWNHGRNTLHRTFWQIQRAAKVTPADKPHYGFHDLRRAFATMNAETLTPDALQALMQHRDYQTTQRYIAIARQLKPAVQTLYVPPVLKAASAGRK